MKARILDRSWNILFVDQAKLDPDNDAECDNPDTPGRQLRLHEGLKGELLLDSLIHEIIHAAAFNLTEPFVEQVATDIASIIWRPSVLRRILDDPLVKKLTLELLRDDYSPAKDQVVSPTKRRHGVREAAQEQADQQEAVSYAPGTTDGMAER